MPQILIIEDENPLREEMVDTLTFQGFEVFQASDGLDGLQLAKAHLPDLIISDITMPHLDGYELLLALREDVATAAIPLIFLTARTDRSFMRHGMELGADDYLTKPITYPELTAAVQARLQRQVEVTSPVAQEQERTKHALIQLISHKLRTPLISVTLVSDIIERQTGQFSAEELHDLFATLHRGSHHLRHLVDQIVFLAEFEIETAARLIAVHGAPSPLGDLLTGATNLARAFACRNREGVIHLNNPDGSEMVNCYLPALKHALAELIANALNFSPEGGEVMIAQWLMDDWVWVNIIDQGCGMDPEQVKGAFRDFYQRDRLRREQPGLGLGLPLARQIIEAHGGRLDLKSVVGRGTQVALRFPIQRQ